MIRHDPGHVWLEGNRPGSAGCRLKWRSVQPARASFHSPGGARLDAAVSHLATAPDSLAARVVRPTSTSTGHASSPASVRALARLDRVSTTAAGRALHGLGMAGRAATRAAILRQRPTQVSDPQVEDDSVTVRGSVRAGLL